MDIGKFLEKNKILFKHKEGSIVHPKLTSGLHSDSYFNLCKLLESTSLTQLMMTNLFESKLEEQKVADSCNSVGGLLTLGSHIVFSLTENIISFRCKQRIVFNKRDNPILSYWNFDEIKQPLLLVDDVLTTGSSFKDLVTRLNGIELAPYLVVLVNRTGKAYLEINNTKFKVISAYELVTNTWKESECPLCKVSKAVKPKSNWEMFFNH